MTREIKFRAWDKADVWVYSSITDSKRMSFYGSHFSMDDNQNCLQFFTPQGKQAPFGDHNSMERYILMQFTGLLDKNGKEIYEGDVVDGRVGTWQGPFEVCFDFCGWDLNYKWRDPHPQQRLHSVYHPGWD